jgi:hypothetical protein
MVTKLAALASDGVGHMMKDVLVTLSYLNDPDEGDDQDEESEKGPQPAVDPKTQAEGTRSPRSPSPKKGVRSWGHDKVPDVLGPAGAGRGRCSRPW